MWCGDVLASLCARLYGRCGVRYRAVLAVRAANQVSRAVEVG
jgi:hypothetical protein